MKYLYKILPVALIAVAATSCDDEIVQDYSVDKPESVETSEYLNSLGVLKDYVNKASSPNFKLGAAVSGSAFTSDGAEYILAKNNFEEVIPSSGWSIADCAGADGTFDFASIASFVSRAQQNGIEIFGAPFCLSANQNCDLLEEKVKNKPDPNAKSNAVLKYTQATAKSNAWDSNFFIQWDEALEVETDYVITFQAKATKAVGLQLELMDPSGTKCTVPDPEGKRTEDWQQSYSSYSDVAKYGVNVGEDWTTITQTFTTLKEAPDGRKFEYKKFQFGTGKVEGDLLIDDFVIYKKSDPDKKNIYENSSFDDADAMPAGTTREELAAVTKIETKVEYSDEVRCLKINCPSNTEAPGGANGQTWATQLWIKSSIDFKKGVSYKFKCRVRADKAYKPGSGIHGDADGDHWISGGVTDLSITTEWQDYVKEGTFEQDYVHESSGQGGHTFAFDLATGEANVIYFDDISLEIGGTEVVKNGDFSSDDLSSFVVKIQQEFVDPEIFDGELKYTVVTVEEVGGIPLTLKEKRDNLLPIVGDWINGLFKNTNGYVKSWNIVSEPLAESNKAGEDINISGSAFSLQSKGANVVNKNDKEVKKNFYWAEYLGKDYVRDLVKLAREAGSANGVSDLKLFVNESRLESNPEKLQSLLDWISYWEEDGTVIDGIGTEMHVSFYADAAQQEAAKEGIENMLNKLKETGKLIRISELDMNYISAAGAPVKSMNVTSDMNKQMAEFYKFIVSKYLEIIPASQQAGICLWTPADANSNATWRAGEPAGLWTEGYQRKSQYAGFVEGLQGK
ncbi:MAG: endo-1,4-beta-xylanase [Bacteroidales bacterium]|nr:endo-1,4-beta-xylanase [Bacteroidales bacterium]